MCQNRNLSHVKAVGRKCLRGEEAEIPDYKKKIRIIPYNGENIRKKIKEKQESISCIFTKDLR